MKLFQQTALRFSWQHHLLSCYLASTLVVSSEVFRPAIFHRYSSQSPFLYHSYCPLNTFFYSPFILIFLSSLEYLCIYVYISLSTFISALISIYAHLDRENNNGKMMRKMMCEVHAHKQTLTQIHILSLICT